MALWSGCESAACDHLSCGESATRNLIDLGRRDFLRDTVMAAAGAIAVRGNRIAGVGAMRDLEHLLSAKTVVIDARDHTVMPGSNDAHTHFIRGGLTYTNEMRWVGARARGLTKDTPNLFGDAIERHASGHPTVLVTSTTSIASLVSVWLRIPRLS